MNIQNADLLFFRPTGWVGRLICRITGSSYCHVGIAEVVGKEIMLIDYRETGFRYLSLVDAEREWVGEAEVWRVEGLTPLQKQCIVHRMKSFPWHGYGFFHLITTGLIRLMPQWLGNMFHWECSRHAPHCSEAVCESYRWGADLDLVPGRPDWQTAPGDIIKSEKISKV